MQNIAIHILTLMQLELNNMARPNKITGIATTSMGKKTIERKEKFEVEESFPVTKQGITLAKLLDATYCYIVLDSEACKFFMSESCYIRNKSLNNMPKFRARL